MKRTDYNSSLWWVRTPKFEVDVNPLERAREIIAMPDARIWYVDVDGVCSVRDITPKQKLLRSTAGNYCVEAYCHLRKANRRFRADRIRHVVRVADPTRPSEWVRFLRWLGRKASALKAVYRA